MKERAKTGLVLSDPTALWSVVHDLCVPMNEVVHLPTPCLEVDEKRHFAVLRAPSDKTRILLVPTEEIEGLESATLLRNDLPNYWSFAWAERGRVSGAAPHPLKWDDVGMAINSKLTRSQDQLHIHVDCVKADLKRLLAATQSQLSNRWLMIDLKPSGGQYWVRDIGEQDLNQNIFKMVAEEGPGPRGSMGKRSIAVVGVYDKLKRPSFALMVSVGAYPAEDLLDHSCKE